MVSHNFCCVAWLILAVSISAPLGKLGFGKWVTKYSLIRSVFLSLAAAVCSPPSQCNPLLSFQHPLETVSFIALYSFGNSVVRHFFKEEK